MAPSQARPETLTPESTVQRTEQVVSSTVENALVMMDVEQGHYFSLDPIGAEIWERLAEPARVTELCAELMQRYAVSSEDCERDVLRLLEELADADLIRTVD
jgi:hypothetical protein